MAELTTTSYVILGLLTSGDLSAYELAEHAGRGVSELWPAAERIRYYAPKVLLEKKLIKAKKESTGRRPRTVYSITPAGHRALARWLTTGPRPSSLESEVLMRVLVADEGSIEDLRNSLQTMVDQATASRDVFVAHATYIFETGGGTFPERQHLFALLNQFMVGHFNNMIAWATWALDQVSSWPDTRSPAETHKDDSRAALENAAHPDEPRLY
jgi:DNA-binding PadR family transcriptional regulator